VEVPKDMPLHEALEAIFIQLAHLRKMDFNICDITGYNLYKKVRVQKGDNCVKFIKELLRLHNKFELIIQDDIVIVKKKNEEDK
jgi:hypothetical protein